MTRDELLRGLPRTIIDDVDMSVIEAIKASIIEDNGQTLHSSLLDKCPFCGCEEPFVQTYQFVDHFAEARVVCPECHVATSRECQAWGGRDCVDRREGLSRHRDRTSDSELEQEVRLTFPEMMVFLTIFTLTILAMWAIADKFDR